jgi:hypothetical protein
MASEREQLEPIAIASPDGRLNRAAIGWARRPLFDPHLPRSASRVHAFDYWCVINRSCALTVLLADVRFAGVALLSFQDLAARRPVERVHVRPFGLPCAMPPTPHGEMAVRALGFELSLRPSGRDLHIEGHARTLLGARITVDVVIARPEGHETINVLVPWDDERFHLTSKQQALPARGEVRVDGRLYRFDEESYACLDFGRGRWPAGVDWCWAFAAGRAGARTIGFNLGSKWTDGTGVTENGMVVDGRVHKIAQSVDFAIDTRDHRRPWRIRAAERADLTFTPRSERAVRVPLGIAGFELHQCVGSFSGTLVDDGGEAIAVEDVMGLAESLHARW